MMEYLDLALDYLKDHRLVAASIAFLFIILLIRNFWFIIKLIVILAIAVIVVLFALSFVGDYVKKKRTSSSQRKTPLSWNPSNRILRSCTIT